MGVDWYGDYLGECGYPVCPTGHRVNAVFLEARECAVPELEKVGLAATMSWACPAPTKSRGGTEKLQIQRRRLVRITLVRIELYLVVLSRH